MKPRLFSRKESNFVIVSQNDGLNNIVYGLLIFVTCSWGSLLVNVPEAPPTVLTNDGTSPVLDRRPLSLNWIGGYGE